MTTTVANPKTGLHKKMDKIISELFVVWYIFNAKTPCVMKDVKTKIKLTLKFMFNPFRISYIQKTGFFFCIFCFCLTLVPTLGFYFWFWPWSATFDSNICIPECETVIWFSCQTSWTCRVCIMFSAPYGSIMLHSVSICRNICMCSNHCGCITVTQLVYVCAGLCLQFYSVPVSFRQNQCNLLPSPGPSLPRQRRRLSTVQWQWNYLHC